MYFCGYSTEQILEKKLPKKLQERGINITFLLGLYAMLELKGNDTSMLVYGFKKGDNYPCAWVECKNTAGKRIVRDYCSEWIELPYNTFHNRFYPDTERLYLDYVFWTRYTDHLHDLIQRPETSFIIGGLSMISPKIKNGKFCNITDFTHEHVDRITGTEFVPTIVKNPDGALVLLTSELFRQCME